MNEYFSKSRDAIDRRPSDGSEKFSFVVGNETCDLDSAVSAICLAYYYNHHHHAALEIPKIRYVPLLNIRRNDLMLKTELLWLARRYGFVADLLLCRDELPENVFASSLFILVDHHMPTAFIPYTEIYQIFDHRPLDDRHPRTCKIVWKNVGSCATVITDLIHGHGHLHLVKLIAPLLWATILLDTVNLSEAAGKAQPLDHQMIARLEEVTVEKAFNRAFTFKQLVKARANIAHLTTMQLLYKDMQIYRNTVNRMALGLPGMPILIEDFLRRPDAVDAVKLFCRKEHCAAALLLGMVINNAGEVRRDMACFHLNNPEVYGRAESLIYNRSSTPFELTMKEERPGEFFLWEQNNVKLPRKEAVALFRWLVEVPPPFDDRMLGSSATLLGD